METVVEAINMNAMISPKMTTPSGLKQMLFASRNPICLPKHHKRIEKVERHDLNIHGVTGDFMQY